jgi:hypothetical protein
MSVPNRNELNAWIRQTREYPKEDAVCALCGNQLNGMHYRTDDDGWYPMPHMKGKETDIIVLCLRCFNEFKRKEIENIPVQALPYYSVEPPKPK